MDAIPSDFIKQLPPMTHLQMVRDAFIAQLIPLLRTLEDCGAFEFPPSTKTGVFDGATFNAYEVPGIAAAGELVANAVHMEGRTFPWMQSDDRSWRRVHEKGPKGELSTWFGGFVERFIHKASQARTDATLLHGLQSLEANTMKARVIATTGTLLGAACALGHAGATSALCESIDLADVYLGERGMFTLMVSDRIFNPLVANVERMWHPARVAMDFCQTECLSIVMDKGWDPENHPLACSSNAHGNPNHARRWFDPLNTVIESQYFLDMMSDNDDGCFHLQPCIADLMMSRLVTPDSVLLPTNSLYFRQWAERFFESDPPQPEMMAVAGRHGLYAISPHLTLLKAAKHGCEDVLPHLAKTLDWDQLPDVRQPMAALFNAEKWHSDRPTGAMAMARFSVSLLDLMIQGGQAHRVLGEPGKDGFASSDSPIQNFAQHGAAEAVLICMEQGADPLEKCELGLNALMCATAGDHDNVVRVIQSFLARQAADDALRECNPAGIEP